MKEARQIDCREQQIAQLFFELPLIARFQHVLDLASFFAQFVENAFGVVPIEAGAGGLLCELQAFECGRNGVGDTVQRGFRFLFRCTGWIS